jgi:hypothetical protein
MIVMMMMMIAPRIPIFFSQAESGSAKNQKTSVLRQTNIYLYVYSIAIDLLHHTSVWFVN